jgi:hypothetical protein
VGRLPLCLAPLLYTARSTALHGSLHCSPRLAPRLSTSRSTALHGSLHGSLNCSPRLALRLAPRDGVGRGG